jgi:hypothetical protein
MIKVNIYICKHTRMRAHTHTHTHTVWGCKTFLMWEIYNRWNKSGQICEFCNCNIHLNMGLNFPSFVTLKKWSCFIIIQKVTLYFCDCSICRTVKQGTIMFHHLWDVQCCHILVISFRGFICHWHLTGQKVKKLLYVLKCKTSFFSLNLVLKYVRLSKFA